MARNCYGYAAGGMPLAFTQEDFLVSKASEQNTYDYEDISKTLFPILNFIPKFFFWNPQRDNLGI